MMRNPPEKEPCLTAPHEQIPQFDVSQRKMYKHKSMKYMPLMVFQIVLLILFFIFVDYGEQKTATRGFEGTHVMIFIGFGFLMTFLKKYAYSALGFNWLLAALSIQWALLCQNWYKMSDNQILITMTNLLEADILAATVLITFGALLGIASGIQLLFISIIEIILAGLNMWLIEHVFKASDVGGSIGIHTFGAYFGLGVSLALRPKKSDTSSDAVPTVDLNGPTYASDITAMIGSIFLWIYWPSFNSGLTTSDSEYLRAVVNTYLSLASATVTTFVLSAAVHGGKLDMVHIQNSTLAGGVGVGAVCNMMIGPGGAIAVGVGAGVISVLGYKYLTPRLTKMGLLDTCGVNNLHGMPGVYSGLLSILFAALATRKDYGTDLDIVFKGMANQTEARTAGTQATYQLIALAVTLGISIGGGILTGLLSKLPICNGLKKSERYDDELNWELP